MTPAPPCRVGFAGVMGALVLAMLTDGMAFFSNTVSGIESIIGFGMAAGIAVVSSFVIMGIWVPLVFMRLEARKESGQTDSEPGPGSGPFSGRQPSPEARSAPGGSCQGWPGADSSFCLWRPS